MKRINIRWQLVLYDLLILFGVDSLLLLLCYIDGTVTWRLLPCALLACAVVFVMRLLGRIYQQIWRYGGVQCYIRLFLADGAACLVVLLLEGLLPFARIPFSLLLAMMGLNLLGALGIRLVYRYAYKCGSEASLFGRALNFLLRIFAGVKPDRVQDDAPKKIKIAIIGAGRVGVSLAEELLGSRGSAYIPRCFVDIDKSKADRGIHGLPVFPEDEDTFTRLAENEIQEVVFAIPELEPEARKRLYQEYLDAGYKIKVYDYPVMQTAGGKRHLREFDIEELLFRKPIVMHEERTSAYYRDKIILITGGGGSIGSELCRQLAKMTPRRIVILDIYENGAYDVQQELKMAFGEALDVCVEIASIASRRSMKRVFEAHRPHIVINAAAHKHVPLMEHNCIEAVENNVFGTKVLVELCEEYGAERFMMVSTDKAVNPTNVMGATKRMCEMIVQSASATGRVKYSATRFGNVLGSAGSVIPLFKRQIAAGGPITVTDKRITRYFMTIPEAAQLVLQSGAMAKNGELFVLDMGEPIKILDLAESMIRISGARDIEIIETGLRPGEKLYEELLVKTEELDKTENHLIFIERETPLSREELEQRLEALTLACASEEDERVREVLHEVVPTFRTPEEVNGTSQQPSGTGLRRKPIKV